MSDEISVCRRFMIIQNIQLKNTVFWPVPDKGLLDDDFQIFGCTKSIFLFTDIGYYPSFNLNNTLQNL